MKHMFILVVLIGLVGVNNLAQADIDTEPTPKIVQLTQEDIYWRSGPAGVSFATVYGNPSKSEHYVMLVKYPPNFKAIAHSHPIEQVVTVIEGTLYSGLGEKFNENELKPYGPGSVFTEPLNTAHFSLTKEKGAIVSITGIGPHSTKYGKSSKSSQKD